MEVKRLMRILDEFPYGQVLYIGKYTDRYVKALLPSNEPIYIHTNDKFKHAIKTKDKVYARTPEEISQISCDDGTDICIGDVLPTATLIDITHDYLTKTDTTKGE